MYVLTTVVAAAALLLVGLLIGRKLKARTAIGPARATPLNSPAPARTPRLPPAGVPPVAARINDEAVEVERLKVKLINCFGGNEGAMARSITFERKKFLHLSETELLKKMLYDFGRGR
jgi:hypothetical protein